MSNNGANAGYGRELAYLLRDNINNKVQDFRSRCCDMIKTNAEITSTAESTGRGNQLTTTVMETKIISFSFPIDFDVTYFSGIDNMLFNLKHWKVQCRKRNSGICDMYYIHDVITGGKKLRSVTEVVNRLLPEGYAKLESKKRKRKVQKEKHAEKEKNVAQSSLSSSKFSPKIEDKENNLEVKNMCCSLVIKVKGNNPQTENILCSSEIDDKAKNLESEIKFCHLMHGDNEENKVVIEAKDEDNLEVRSDNLLFPSAYVPRKKRSYKKRVRKEKQAEKEKNISLSSQISSTFSLRIEDKVNNSKVENISCPIVVKVKGNNSQAENVFCPPEIKDKAKNSEFENISCPPMSKDKKNNSETENYICPNRMDDIENILEVGDVSIENLLNPQEIQVGSLLLIPEVQPIDHVNQGVMEDMLKACDHNNLILGKDDNNYEVLPEITEDFSKYDDLIESFFK
ncbi:unnamed protein product [Vicia faba]|uniref:Uncharacterized protein n=1 Tax=Vicia faba TaxID=3906 RepID=A0AAV0ZSZ4_VICFA|nr:unnamed protein product [Vicia faba]